ncbi:hypothetical protein [Lederbergia citri]|uniref:Uncharacterized protein n=1 Tax=Lederbergia citri TaxID=2833580 RepID=A0A942YGN2_9BACI|nr:hypothetical protein [Lederbergia citri]MBS4196353.1 hypothetical protein [Lederbergia citri]
MKKSASTEVKRGQAISFRVPSDTPDYLLKHLQKLKETERRNFSSKIAEFVMQGVGQSFSRERETITVPLPKKLSKSQRNWLKHEHSEALLGSIIYQLLSDPVRTASLLASLNSKSLNLDEALYLQEDVKMEDRPFEISKDDDHLQSVGEPDLTDEVDDLQSFDWNSAKYSHSVSAEEENDEEEDDLESLLGDFLAEMNK